MSCGCSGPQNLNSFGCCCRCGELPAVREEGPPGPAGPDGGVPVFEVGTVTTGSPDVIITQVTPLLYTIDFVLPNVPTNTPNTWSDTQTFTVAAIFNGGFTANDDCTVDADLTVTGNTTLNNVSIGGTLSANGTSTFQNISVFNNLDVSGNANVTGGLSVASTSDLVGGILGRLDGVAAAINIVGEILEAEVLVGAAVSLVTGTAKSVTSIALTAGQWNIYGIVNFTAAGATTIDYLGAGISIVDNAQWTDSEGVFIPGGGVITAIDLGVTVPAVPANNPGGLLYFLVAKAGFAVDTLTAYGKIWAIRVR